MADSSATLAFMFQTRVAEEPLLQDNAIFLRLTHKIHVIDCFVV